MFGVNNNNNNDICNINNIFNRRLTFANKIIQLLVRNIVIYTYNNYIVLYEITINIIE